LPLRVAKDKRAYMVVQGGKKRLAVEKGVRLLPAAKRNGTGL
jgi:hypothetical protein